MGAAGPSVGGVRAASWRPRRRGRRVFSCRGNRKKLPLAPLPQGPVCGLCPELRRAPGWALPPPVVSSCQVSWLSPFPTQNQPPCALQVRAPALLSVKGRASCFVSPAPLAPSCGSGGTEGGSGHARPGTQRPLCRHGQDARRCTELRSPRTLRGPMRKVTLTDVEGCSKSATQLSKCHNIVSPRTGSPGQSPTSTTDHGDRGHFWSLCLGFPPVMG